MKKLTLTMFVLLVFFSTAFTASASEFNKFSWLGLWNTPMLTWAENKNRIDEFCPVSLPEVEMTQCKRDNLKTKIWIISVYAEATSKSSKIGELRMSIKPGKPFEYSFWSSLTEKSISFTPDMFDPDWGYGPTSHQTVIDRKGDWIKLPKNPFPKDVWIKLDSKLVQKELRTIQIKKVYTLEGKNLIVLKVEKEKLLVRVEQDADYWCNSGTPPPLKKLNPFWVDKKELWDSDQHLKLQKAHTRGC